MPVSPAIVIMKKKQLKIQMSNEGVTTSETEGATTRQTEGATTRQTDSVPVHITNNSMNSELECPKIVSDIVKNCVKYFK